MKGVEVLPMRPIPSVVTPIVASLLLLFAACDHQTSTAPDLVSSSSSTPVAVTARVDPARLAVSAVATASCPSTPPFTTSFNLMITSQAIQPLTVDQVTFHFLDGSNVSSQPITFPGGALIPTNGTITLPFAPSFGCGIGTPRWVVGEVTMHDATGRTETVSVRATAH
jgi:hypothetical protein